MVAGSFGSVRFSIVSHSTRHATMHIIAIRFASLAAVRYWGGDPRVEKPPFSKLIPAVHGLMNPEAVEQWLPGKSMGVSAAILHRPPLHNEYEHLRDYFQKRRPDLLTNTYAVYQIPPNNP